MAEPGGGSSDSHTHVDAGHTHTENAHTHTVTVGAQTGVEHNADDKDTSIAALVHTHTATPTGNPTATEQEGYAEVAEADGRPPWKKLNIIENETGGADLPTGTIALWDQTVALIPDGWIICDGNNDTPNMNNYFVQGAEADINVGDTGGALDHTHAAGAAHSHTINSHDHTYTIDESTTTGAGPKLTGGNASPAAHTHPNYTISGGGTTSEETVTLSANVVNDNRPPYKEIVFIQYEGPTNNTPSLDEVTDSPADIGVGATLSFEVDWTDADAGELIKVAICKGSGIATTTVICKDGWWASSTAFTTNNPETVTYTTISDDLDQTRGYWAFVCDDSAQESTACSVGTYGTFSPTNQRPDAPTSLQVNGLGIGSATNLTDLNPDFTAVYQDTNDEGDQAVKYCVEVDTQNDFLGEDMWISDGASCYTGTNLGGPINHNDTTENITYDGAILGLDGTTYYWRIWLWDGEERSATSTTGWFSMFAQPSDAGAKIEGRTMIKGRVKIR